MSGGTEASRALRVLVVLGTRPEAIKLAPVILELRQKEALDVYVAATGQHREMVDQVLTPFGILPDADLDLMESGQSLSLILERAVGRLDALYKSIEPDMVIVQGDTTSAFGGAVAAFHRRIRVAHVEAGLRSNDRFHPFPEEVNRRMISEVADLHLAPTRKSAENLLGEGICQENILITGNTAVDAILFATAHSDETTGVAPVTTPAGSPIVLITLHRRESWLERTGPEEGEEGTALEGLAKGLRQSAHEHPHCSFVFPVHPNPSVRGPVHSILGDVSNVWLTEPIPYFSFAQLMGRSAVIVTDSGGIQEEAPSLGIPVLIMRRNTERPEGLESARSRLVGTDPQDLESELRKALESAVRDPAGRPFPNPFGDGKAARRVAEAVLFHFGKRSRPADFLFRG